MLSNLRAARAAFLVTLLSAGTISALAFYAVLQDRQFSAVFPLAASLPYFLIGTLSLRGKITLLTRPVLGVAAALAVIESTNIILEQFFALPLAARAVVPATAMAAVVLAAAGLAVRERSSRGVPGAVAAAVLGVGIGMVVSCAVGLGLIAVSAWQRGQGASPDLAQGLANAGMHLVLPLPLAAGVGFLAAIVAGRSRSRRMLSVLSLAGLLTLSAGVALLVRAASLPREERPGLVLPGMLLAALGLTLLPSFLAPPLQYPSPSFNDTFPRNERYRKVK